MCPRPAVAVAPSNIRAACKHLAWFPALINDLSLKKHLLFIFCSLLTFFIFDRL